MHSFVYRICIFLGCINLHLLYNYNYMYYMIKIVSFMQTRLFKYIENFTSKNWNFSDKESLIFFIFLLKT